MYQLIMTSVNSGFFLFLQEYGKPVMSRAGVHDLTVKFLYVIGAQKS
jgi:hypothetical protein